MGPIATTLEEEGLRCSRGTVYVVAVERRVVEVRPRTVLVALALALAVTLAILFVWFARRVLVWILIAALLSLALDHVVSKLSRWMPRTPAAIATFLAVGIAIGGVGFALIPSLVREFRDFVKELPALVEELSQGRGPLGELERRFEIVERVQDFVDERGASGVAGLSQPLVDVLQGVATTVFAFVAIGFLTLFLLIEGPRWKERLIRLSPASQTQLWEGIAVGIHTAVGGWILGAILLSTLAGLSAGLVLFILGVPFAIALAMIVAVLDPIPFIGATLAAVIVTLAVLATQGFWPALIFLIFLLVYQNVVENHILVPVVYGRTLRLSALVILLAVLVGGELAGIVGALIAIPIAGSISVVVTQTLAWRRGDLDAPATSLLESEPPAQTQPAPSGNGE